MSVPRARLLDQAKLHNSLQELAASADNLNALSDQLNKQVIEVESAEQDGDRSHRQREQ